MSRKPEPGFRMRIVQVVDGYALPWLKRHHGKASLRRLAAHAGLSYGTLYGWYGRGRTPDRAQLLRFLQSVRLARPEHWAIWITTGYGERPYGPFEDSVPEPVVGSPPRSGSIPYQAPPLDSELVADGLDELMRTLTPAELIEVQRLEDPLRTAKLSSLVKLTDLVLAFAIEGLKEIGASSGEPMTETMKRRAQGGAALACMRIEAVIARAKRTGLLMPVLVAALTLSIQARADALDSGSSTRKSVQVQVLSSALRLLLRLIRRALKAGGSAGPTPPDDSPDDALTAAGAYGSVHRIADIRARYFLPKSGRSRGTGRPAGRRVG